ncbi:MAG: hypothetical protein ACOX22_03480 [Caldicoprobacterales bacterium]|jgi:stage III sporulation protein AB
MFVKILNSFVIVIASTLLGRELANKYVNRVNELSALQVALSRLETEIEHYASRLPEAMIRIGNSIGGTAGKLFYIAGQSLTEKSSTLSEVWNTSLDLMKPEWSLRQEDSKILRRFGDQLGNSDREGQIRFIRLTLAQLHDEEVKARAAREKYDKMYRSLGLLGGIALAIILL